MKIQTKIQKWGNSLALRISGPIKSIPHFRADMLVDVEINEAGITVKPVAREKLKHFKERELLAGLTADVAHVDELPKLSDKEWGN